jgi:hypothetical protein
LPASRVAGANQLRHPDQAWREWFLDQHVQPALQERSCHRHVQVGGRADDRRVETRVA